MGNAVVQGALWGRRAQDWAELQESAFRPLYNKAIRDMPFVYRDLDHALGAILSWGPAVRATQEAGEQALRSALAEALAPFERPDGTYDLPNTLRFLVATA